MSQKTSEFESAIRTLERQAAELIHKETDLLTVVCGFEFSEAPVFGEAIDKWKAQYGCHPMVRTFYCKELAGFTATELYEYLADAERAGTLGFDPDQFTPDKPLQDGPLSAAWRDRFSGRLKSFIIQSAECILAVAHDMGNPLGLRALTPTDKATVRTAPDVATSPRKPKM